ncbi:uncharacterized protein LOC127702278 [Mytilus californianus]|uniref:uncharacterized protein LOC127702278 n=1 Tax=Mytilus californianus TaxID=6549 RepID=UPI002247FA19|nr:uncharacterized protein LOC127702278 [Mytilus californianus]
MKEQTQNFETIAENTGAMKNEIVDELRRYREDYRIHMRNIIFEVKTVVQSDLASPTNSTFEERQCLQNDNICYVEWKLATPSNWNIDDIKKTLENVASLIGQWFRIVFVYKGSLVIYTSVPVHKVKDDKDFQLAVHLFLKDVVERCDLDTVTKTIIILELVVSNEILSRQNIDKPTVSCDCCNSKNSSTRAIHHCIECQENLCHKCTSVLTGSLSEHNLTHPKVSRKETFQTTCFKHRDCAFDFFCVDHDCLCCCYCTDQEHTSCQKSIPLEVAAKDVKHSPMLEDFSDALSNLKTAFGKAITSQNENINNIDDDAAIIVKQVKLNKAEIITRLDELQNEIKEDIYAIRKKEKAESESKKSRLIQIASRIQNMSAQWYQTFKHGSENEIFVLLNICKWKFMEHEASLRDVIPTLKKKLITFMPQKAVPKPVRLLGSIELQSSQYNFNYKPTNIQQVQVPVTVYKMPTKFTLDYKVEIKQFGGVSVTGLCVTDDNRRILLCNHQSTKLLVYSDIGDYLQDCELSGDLWDIAVIPDEDKAVVTLPKENSVQFIDIKTMTAGSKHSVPDHCYSVTIVNQKISVCGIYSRNLHILDKHGNHIITVKIPGTGYIHYLHPGPDDSVYYTDSTYNGVSCVTLNGEEVFRYTSQHIIEPRNVITDKKGNLYVACIGSNDIQRLSSNGEFIDVILDVKNGINHPCGMTFRNDFRKLFVLNECENLYSLLVFTCS